MSEEQELDTSYDADIRITFPATLIAGVILAAVSSAGGYYFRGTVTPNPNEIAQANSQKAQAEAAKAQADFGTAVQKRTMELQEKVIENCVAAKNTPVWVNGNLDCKKFPSEK